MSLQKATSMMPADLENWIEDMLYPTPSSSHSNACSQAPSSEIKEGIEEIRIKGVENLDEYTVVTEIRREDSITAALQRISSFTATWPSADSSGIHAFYGHIDIDVSFDEAIKKARKKVEFSKKLNKLFVDINHWFPVHIQIKEKSISSLPQGTTLRITPYFVEGEHSNVDVKVCPIHQHKDQHPHLIRCKNKNTKYAVESGDISRYSLTLPFSGKLLVEHLQFLCFSSCHELKRKKMEVLFTLEVAGRVIGKTSIEVKVCSYPGRDIKQEESKSEEGEVKSEETKKGKRKSSDGQQQIQAQPIQDNLSVSTSTAVVKHDPKSTTTVETSVELVKQVSFSAPPPPNPNQVYTVKVQGYENYRIICKILSGMEALKSIKNDVNASAAIAQESFSNPLKREGSHLSEDGDNGERKKAKSASNQEDSQGALVSTQPSESSPLYQWLDALKLTQYYHNFADQGYDDLEVLKELDEKDFQHLNIKLPGHCKKLLLAAKKLREISNPSSSTSSTPSGMNQFEQIERIEKFEKTTIMKRYHSALQ